VIARFASHPMGANAHLDPTSLPAYHALARHLMEAGSSPPQSDVPFHVSDSTSS